MIIHQIIIIKITKIIKLIIITKIIILIKSMNNFVKRKSFEFPDFNEPKVSYSDRVWKF